MAILYFKGGAIDGGIKSVAQKDERCHVASLLKKHTAFEGILPLPIPYQTAEIKPQLTPADIGRQVKLHEIVTAL